MDNTVGNLDAAVILDQCVRSDNPLREPHTANYRLEYGAWLINHGYCFIIPADRRIFIKNIRIEGRTAGHTKYLACIRVHDDSCGAFRLSALNSIIHRIFQHVLHLAV